MVLSEFETTASGASMLVLIGQGIYGNIKQAAFRFTQIRMIIKPN
jgi:xylulokinase